MGQRSDFGADWSEFIVEWCLGTPLAITPDEGWNSLDALERLWPEYLDRFLTQGSKGILYMAPMVERGHILAACEELAGFAPVLERLRADHRDALSEVCIAAALVGLGYWPILEPPLNNKHPDMSVIVNNETVYVEVIAPEDSAVMKRAQAKMRALAQEVVERTSGTRTEVLLHQDITPQVREAVLQAVSALTPSGLVHELPNVASIRGDPLPREEIPNVGPTIPSSAPPTIIGVAHFRITPEQPQTGSIGLVRLPMTDNRVARLMEAESDQFGPDTTNILVIDVSAYPSALKHWPALLHRRFQPSINTRFGAVILWDQKIVGVAMKQHWVVVRNPHARNPPPETLLQAIEHLNGDDNEQG